MRLSCSGVMHTVGCYVSVLPWCHAHRRLPCIYPALVSCTPRLPCVYPALVSCTPYAAMRLYCHGGMNTVGCHTSILPCRHLAIFHAAMFTKNLFPNSAIYVSKAFSKPHILFGYDDKSSLGRRNIFMGS